MRSACVSPAAQAAWSLLAAYGAAPPKLRQEQLPKVVPQTCQVRMISWDLWRLGRIWWKSSEPDKLCGRKEGGMEHHFVFWYVFFFSSFQNWNG